MPVKSEDETDVIYNWGNLLINKEQLLLGEESIDLKDIEEVSLLTKKVAWLRIAGIIFLISGLLTLLLLFGVILVVMGIVLLVIEKRYFICLTLSKSPYRFTIEFNQHFLNFFNRKHASEMVRAVNERKRIIDEDFKARVNTYKVYDSEGNALPSQIEINGKMETEEALDGSSNVYLSFDSESTYGCSVYILDWWKFEGDWISYGDNIFRLQIGDELKVEMSYQTRKGQFVTSPITSNKEGVLQIIKKGGEIIKNGDILFKLHPKGIFPRENSVLLPSYNHLLNIYDLKQTKIKSANFQIQKIHRNDGEWVNKDDLLLTLVGGCLLDDSEIFTIKAQKSGYIDYESRKSEYLRHGKLLYIIHENDDSRVNRKYPFSPLIIEDEFNGNKSVKWQRVADRYYSEYIITKSDSTGAALFVSFNYLINKDYIVFKYSSRDYMLSKSDVISFLFIDSTILNFVIEDNPYKIDNEIYEFKVPIADDELGAFANKEFHRWKIELKRQNREIIGGDIGGEDYISKKNLSIVLRRLALEYRKVVKKEIPDYTPWQRTSENQIRNLNHPENYAEECFVYLMVDTKNDYYKIGISNNPVYREKTLQSEKPTIELLASKNFPSRKLAESFEKALHETYRDKRLRGEWFDLKPIDIEHIIISLK